MQIPAAGQIEGAKDQLKTLDPKILADQSKELHAAIGTKLPQFVEGYQLGLQVARFMIATSVAIQQAGVKPDDVL